MKRVHILTDSTADIPEETAQELGITVVPAYVQIEGQSLRDKEQITRSEFYRRLPNLTQSPTTSVPPANDFGAAFRGLANQASEVIAILVSTTLSGMLNAARLGSEQVPELPVHLVDSGQLAMGLGWQVIVAAEAAAKGKEAQEILALIQEIQPRIRVLAMLDTVEHLRRSGRVAWARAVAANLLRIKPIINFRQGEAILVSQIRTRRKATLRLLQMVRELGPIERFAALHTHSPDLESFRSQLGELFPIEQTLVSEVGPIVGTHIGPRALGIAAIVAA